MVNKKQNPNNHQVGFCFLTNKNEDVNSTIETTDTMKSN